MSECMPRDELAEAYYNGLSCTQGLPAADRWINSIFLVMNLLILLKAFYLILKKVRAGSRYEFLKRIARCVRQEWWPWMKRRRSWMPGLMAMKLF